MKLMTESDRFSRKVYDMPFIEERTFSVFTFINAKG